MMRPKSAATVGSRILHDPDVYRKKKIEESNPYFKECKVQTCSHIIMDKSGRSVAIAYPVAKTGWKHPASYQNMNKSSEVESLMR